MFLVGFKEKPKRQPPFLGVALKQDTSMCVCVRIVGNSKHGLRIHFGFPLNDPKRGTPSREGGSSNSNRGPEIGQL